MREVLYGVLIVDFARLVQRSNKFGTTTVIAIIRVKTGRLTAGEGLLSLGSTHFRESVFPG